eukprot:3181020-Amphidinium_carterae.1
MDARVVEALPARAPVEIKPLVLRTTLGESKSCNPSRQVQSRRREVRVKFDPNGTFRHPGTLSLTQRWDCPWLHRQTLPLIPHGVGPPYLQPCPKDFRAAQVLLEQLSLLQSHGIEESGSEREKSKARLSGSSASAQLFYSAGCWQWDGSRSVATDRIDNPAAYAFWRKPVCCSVRLCGTSPYMFITYKLSQRAYYTLAIV